MLNMKFLILLQILGLLVLRETTGATTTTNDQVKTLVLLQNVRQTKGLYGTFFATLEARDHELFFEDLNDDAAALPLQEFGKLKYNNVIVFAPSVDFSATQGEALLVSILKFVDDGGNLLLATSSEASDWTLDLASECGVEVKKITMQDSFLNANDADYTLFSTSKAIQNPYVLRSNGHQKVYYRGAALGLASTEEFLLSLLNAESTSYGSSESGNSLKQANLISNSNTPLVVGVQARNNARVVISGSTDAFSDAFMSMKDSTNGHYFDEITRWGFGERGILRAMNVTHHLESGGKPETQIKHSNKEELPISIFPDPEVAPNALVYRIKDDVVFKFNIEVQEGKDQWVPFNADDVQLEFVMMDPYIRKSMKNDKKGHYELHFTIPDVYGVYKFRVIYRRPGLSTLHVEKPVTVRPFRHNEYERFIVAAYPYYASAFSMMIGWFMFLILFIYTK